MKVKLFALIGFFIISTIGLGFIMQGKSEPLVFVNVKEAVNLPAKLLAESYPKTATVMMTRYAGLLPKIIQRYSINHHVTVIGAPVLAGKKTVDVTHAIIALTLTELTHA